MEWWERSAFGLWARSTFIWLGWRSLLRIVIHGFLFVSEDLAEKIFVDREGHAFLPCSHENFHKQKAMNDQTHKFYFFMPCLQFWSHQSQAESSVQTELHLRVHDVSFGKCTIYACNHMLRICLSAYTPANHMARFRGTHVPHLLRTSYSITFRAVVHMYILYTICLQ